MNRDREFLNWVYQYGPAAEILEPKAYRDAMRERLERWREPYQ
ncbi:WYL domain-containing protein [Paenibacillus mucilaginosus]|nr:WYL domain-containing protein [Paenibacillus mucilaginosus]WFA21731.1 WYL domain-containing protein [Paenibacillus mucilaginosus]